MTLRKIGQGLTCFALSLLLASGATGADRRPAGARDTETPTAAGPVSGPVTGEIERSGNTALRVVPATIPFQGFLTEADGTPIGIGGGTTVNVVAALHTAPAAPALVWGPETHNAVPVNDGVFVIELGSVTPLPLAIFGPGPLWLDLTVDGTGLSPRTQFHSVPFAMRAGVADVADVAIADDGDWTVSGSHIYRLTGNVGIGITVPSKKLHVNGDLRVDTAGSPAMQTVSSGDVKYLSFQDAGSGNQLAVIGGSNTDGTGFLALRNGSGSTTVEVDGDGDDIDNGVETGLVTVRSRGTGGPGGQIQVENNDGVDRITMSGGGSGEGGELDLYNETGVSTVFLDGDAVTGADIRMYTDSGVMTVDIDSDDGGLGGKAAYYGPDGLGGVWVIGGLDPVGGEVRVFSGFATISLDGGAPDSSAEVRVKSKDGYTRVIVDGDDYGAGLIEIIQDDHSTSGILLRGEEFSSGGNGSVLELIAEDGTETIELDSGFGPNTGYLFVDGSIVGDSKSALITTRAGEQRLMYCTESPEHWFEEVGSGQLRDGSAEIVLDPLYLETVTIDAKHPMRVIVTPTADCKGVYVEKGTDRFVVRELFAGRSDATFDYKVVCKRAGYEDERLELFVAPGEDDLSDPGSRPRIRPPIPDERFWPHERDEGAESGRTTGDEAREGNPAEGSPAQDSGLGRS